MNCLELIMHNKDVNKWIVMAAAWNPRRSADDLMREYAHWTFGTNGAKHAERAIDLMECGVAHEPDPAATEPVTKAVAALEKALDPWAKRSIQFGVLKSRAEIDSILAEIGAYGEADRHLAWIAGRAIVARGDRHRQLVAELRRTLAERDRLERKLARAQTHLRARVLRVPATRNPRIESGRVLMTHLGKSAEATARAYAAKPWRVP